VTIPTATAASTIASGTIATSASSWPTRRRAVSPCACGPGSGDAIARQRQQCDVIVERAIVQTLDLLDQPLRRIAVEASLVLEQRQQSVDAEPSRSIRHATLYSSSDQQSPTLT